MTDRPRRLLTIGHSYVVANNRRLAHAMAVAGAGEWEVTAVAPARYPGDLRPIELEPMEGEACRVVPLPVRFAHRPHVMFYQGLGRVLREGWDVVHCWQEPFIAPAAQTAALAPGSAALVFSTFQNIPKRYPPPFAQMERYAMRRADGWIAFGRTVEEALRDREGYRDRPHRVISPGVDVERFRPDRSAVPEIFRNMGWEADGPPVVGFLGRFVPEKGIETLMQALDRIRDLPWRALFVGGGPHEWAVRRWGEHFPARVRVVKGVRHEAVPGYLNGMDVLCAPSLTTEVWREQFGRMLVEAMACGVAVLGSDSGEIPHVVGGAGRIAAEGDVDAWADALRELVTDHAARADLAARGLGRARTEFALDVVARRHLDFFAELADRKEGRG
ncbi:MAG TPA: glycosyltransferase family 4 protein [Longimicrobium sp.]|nr:glycosyltransferase family 4 protein [Longimicrobium sp.]